MLRGEMILTTHPWDLALQHHTQYDKILHCSPPIPNRHPVPTTPCLTNSHRRKCSTAIHDILPPMPPRMVWHYSRQQSYCHNWNEHCVPLGREVHSLEYHSWIPGHCNTRGRRWWMHRVIRRWQNLWPMVHIAKRGHQLQFQ